MTLVDCGIVFSVSFISAALNLFVEWFFIYSSPDYKKREEQIESAQKHVDRIKETTTGNAKKQEKRLADADARLKELQQKQSMSKMWSMILMPVFLMSVLSIVNSMYQGHAVARLPFEPFGMMQRLSHRGLMGSDMQECSVVCLT
jgi:calcium load-activated calcium channel